jgi:hypothetical protein
MCSFDADKQTPALGVSEPVADWEQRLMDESAVQSVLMRHCETSRVWIDREQKLVWKCAGCDHSYGVNPHIVPNLNDLEYSQVAYHQAAMVLEEIGDSAPQLEPSLCFAHDEPRLNPLRNEQVLFAAGFAIEVIKQSLLDARDRPRADAHFIAQQTVMRIARGLCEENIIKLAVAV